MRSNAILITGGAGYIGSHTVKTLIDAGHRAIVYDNLSTGFRDSVDSRAEFVLGDILDTRFLVQTMEKYKVSCVMHFAAKLSVKESVEKPFEYYNNNVLGLNSVLLAMKETSVEKIVFSSTAAVFGDHIQNRPISESDVKQPINPYGWSKLICEALLQQYSQSSSLKYCILRYFNAAGAELELSNGQKTAQPYHLVHMASLTALGVQPQLKIFGTDYPTPDGTCIRDYIHVQDLAEIHLKGLNYILEKNVSVDFNCGYGRGHSVLEVVKCFKSISKDDFPVHYDQRRDGDPAYLVADSAKLKELLKWEPKFDQLDVICQTAYDWEKKYRKLD